MSIELVNLPKETLFLVSDLIKYQTGLEISKDALEYTIKGLIKTAQEQDQEGIDAFTKAGVGLIPIIQNFLLQLDAYADDIESGGAVLSFVQKRVESEE
jgi:hypothetical protein